jgi:23S rRNA pseudouridine2605 synthase
MNKPKDTITTLHDERGRSTVIDLVHSRDRVYPVGRLDRNTTGVLLLTNDGDFAHRLMHPRFEIPKSYEVTCDAPVSREHLRQLARGVPLEDGMTAPAAVAALPGGKGKEVGITIREGRNRQVRRMFEHLGYGVVKLDRVAYGPVTKAGLPRGATRKLTRTEVRELRRIAGMPD